MNPHNKSKNYNHNTITSNIDDDYYHLLSKFKYQRVYVCPYPGNSGDELIVLGTLQILKTIGIDRVMNASDADFILYPGGNPTMWKEDIAVWLDIWRRFPNKKFIVGPATFKNFERYWIEAIDKSNRNADILVARDPESYSILQSESLSIIKQKILAHDPAFYLRGTDLVNSWKEGASEDHDLYSFRNDHEGGGSLHQSIVFFEKYFIGRILKVFERIKRRTIRNKKFKKACSISDGKLPIVNRDASLLNFDMFLDIVLRARHIHTDRLHVMILASLLNKKVYAYSTGYGKLEGVYHHSMESWSNVEFIK